MQEIKLTFVRIVIIYEDVHCARFDGKTLSRCKAEQIPRPTMRAGSLVSVKDFTATLLKKQSPKVERSPLHGNYNQTDNDRCDSLTAVRSLSKLLRAET